MKMSFFAFFLFLTPNIADIVLTSIDISKDNLTYFILRYTTQFFTIFMIYVCFLFYVGTNEYGIDELGNLIPFLIAIRIYLILDIICLVFFIINFSDLNNLARIGYYIHFIYYLFIVSFPIFKYSYGPHFCDGLCDF